VHSRSSLVFELKGEYQEFVTSFGRWMTGPAPGAGRHRRRILVDGQKRLTQGRVRPGTLHGPVREDVTRASRLELIVDYGENGDVQDRFNWVESGLIRP